MAIGDDVSRSVSLGREGEADGGYGRKKKKVISVQIKKI